MRRRWGTVVAATALVAVTSCAAPSEPPAPPRDPEPARATWQLGHRITATSGLRVVARSVSRYEESTEVLLPAAPEGCFVSWDPSGTYGPDNLLGEKIAVQVAGRPGVRDGAGAEGPYLMWQPQDRGWARVSCYPEDDPDLYARVAEAVVWKPSSIALPFDLTVLPAGYTVGSIDADLRTGRTAVRVAPPLGTGPADAGLLLSFDDPLPDGAGRPVTVGGRPATLSDDGRWPRLCLVEQSHRVCVGAESDDTGPYPDRSAEEPTLLAIAGALRFPADLDDRSTWFAAEDVFG